MLTSSWIEHELASALGEDFEVLTRERSLYSTSFPVDDVLVRSASGRELRLVVKDLAWEALLPEASRSKPRSLYDPCREIGVYAELLDTKRHGTARSYATAPTGLILEKVDGRELFQVGERELWFSVARWARSLHAAFEDETDSLAASGVPLLRHDAAFYRHWLDRAMRSDDDPRLRAIASRYDGVIDLLLSQPRTLIHGELYPSNVLVTDRGRVCAIDWEMAAIGPGCVDIAALSSGRGWTEADREALVDAYVGTRTDGNLRAAIDAARVYLALQWLGWSDPWTPPADRAQDWLGDAVDALARLRI